jgi:aminopeptidase N
MSRFTLFFLLLCSGAVSAQTSAFSREDTLRGSITPERVWWDWTSSNLEIRVLPDSTISGSNTLFYTALQAGQTLQIDLQPPLKVTAMEQDGTPVPFRRISRNVWYADLPAALPKGSRKALTVRYSGKPRIAPNAPWDGGFSWRKDTKGRMFAATSCQGLGASVWWPCKDHAYDEPDSIRITANAPAPLKAVANGRLVRTAAEADGTTTFEWAVKNPINNYGVNINIGAYEHWNDTLQGKKGILTLDYYVLPENLSRAKEQFKQVKLMLRAFEHWFGPYPFYEDGYKLVEVPYLGMEHQSSITYGNKYRNGYLGMDLSGSGWGLKWDFIIIHESGHEWFANNITYKDIADMWIHESFTNYSESLFTEYYYGKTAGAEYVRGTRKNIDNDRPIIGMYNVNHEGSGDMYYKGGNMLHTIRQVVDNDALWLDILRGLNRDFYHQTVTSDQVEQYMIQKSGKKLQKIFDQYLRNTTVPMLDYSLKKGKFRFRWTNCVEGFDMPVKVSVDGGEWVWITPGTAWQTIKLKGKNLTVSPEFYVGVK